MAIKNTNSRIGTTTNLPSGAKYDLLMITFPDGFPESQLLFAIDMTPRKVTGIQKIAQVFMKILFTTKGSDIIYPGRGTNFSSYTINANIVTADQILQANLIESVNDAKTQTQILSNGYDPASSLADATILGIDVGQESVVMYVQIVTDSGVTAQLSVPFPQLGLT